MLFRAQAGDSASGPSSTSSAKPQWRCAAGSADEVDCVEMMRKLGDEGELFLLFGEVVESFKQPQHQCCLRGYWPLLFLQCRSPRFNFIHMAFSSAVSLGEASFSTSSARAFASRIYLVVLSSSSNAKPVARGITKLKTREVQNCIKCHILIKTGGSLMRCVIDNLWTLNYSNNPGRS